MPDDFVHLHVHSEYSLLDGLGRTAQLARRAAELGQPALALTDHGVMHGAIEFVRACKKEGVKPIIGVEAYITQFGRPMTGRDTELDKGRHHLLLLAENMTGYRNLLRLCTDAQFDGYYYRPRIDADYLAAHSEGLICTSGCLAAELPTLIREGREDLALQRLHWYREVFGPDRWYVEFQEHDIPELTQVNRRLFEFATKHRVPIIVTNDVHFVREEDFRPHDMLLCVQTSSLVTDEKRLRYGGTYFLKSLDQMRQTFLPLADLPDSAFTNTLKIAEMCNVDPEDESYHLPDVAIPEGFTYETYLRHLTEEGLKRRYAARADDPEVRGRAERELKVIHTMGFDVYYLIVWDLCMYAKRRSIWWNVRGSGAGSIVAYAIGITNLDPLRNKLIFERFLNPGRVTMPDFDLDFPDDQRDELIRYTVEKYGNDRVAQIVTFGRMKARASVRDVGRAMGVSLDEVDKIAKLIPAIPGKPVTIREVLTPGHESYSADLRKMYDEDAKVRELLDVAAELDGVARHSSIHAAAVIIADRELTHYTPLMRPPKSAITQTVTQYEFPILESIGLLKVDFLGLATLTLMREAARLIKERHGIEYTLENLPVDDPKTYELLASGDVMGVFQVEGAGMRRCLMDLRPTQFDHIVATISLYRPGPMEFIPDFIACLHGEKQPEYVHKVLEPILSETMGVCVSGDAWVFDARTGQRYRLDQVGSLPELVIQGIDENWQPATGRVSRWIDSGYKPVYRVTLRNGSQIQVTADHRLLTENGWRALSELQIGDFIGTPPALLGPLEGKSQSIDRRKLRILAYLIADGSLTSGTMVDFVSKDLAMLAEYQRCLAAFDDVSSTCLNQVRGVIRIGAAKTKGKGIHYHTPNSLLTWLRELGLKYPAGSKPGGAHSRDRFVPAFVFGLDTDDIAFFLASLWDGDGYMSSNLCHYRTTSRRLAEDIQMLLLRLGVASTIYTNYYSVRRSDNVIEKLPSYQVTVYDTKRLADLLQPYMVTAKKNVPCLGVAEPDLARAHFMAELSETWPGTQKGLMRATGFDGQHFGAQHRQRERIPARVAALPAQRLHMPATMRRLNVVWQKIVSIEPVGVEHVYDLTVEGLHNFVANGIIVHNCVYQEQVIQILTDVAGYTPGEADLVRRGISKKSKKTLDEHREIFAAGAAAKSGLSREEADKIWDALMGFARYGFNRAHAADYAVIVAQTAFLKAYYPVEYMTALLTVERHNTEKVGLLIAECRRMGIEVLPPSVNVSGHNFTIEQMPPGRTPPRQNTVFPFPVTPGVAIRMGLDAIKNVGEGAVDLILQARKGRPFANLADFAKRVDLRQINRRGLECLIKAGALDDFGERGRLLAGIDRIMTASEQAHVAREIGQFSLFGDLDDDISSADDWLEDLPHAAQVSPKELLAWEKELVGVYVSSHPLQQMTVDLMNVVTHSTAEITEEVAGKAVVIAGMVAEVRTHTTKKGETMAFVRLEDLQGTVDVTVFPQLYKDKRHLWTKDKIVIVFGKADVRNGRVGVIADAAQDYVEGVRIVEDTTSVYHRYRSNAVAPVQPAVRGAPSNHRAVRASDRSGGLPEPAAGRFAIARWDAAAEDDEDVYFADDNPFAQEAPDWLQDEAGQRDAPAAGRATDELPQAAPPADQLTFEEIHLPAAQPGATEVATTKEGAAVSSAEPPRGRTITLTLRRSHSLEADRRRLAELVDLLAKYHGTDRFEIIVEANGRRRYRLDFPNHHTHICRELLAELTQRLGAGTWQVSG